MAQFKSRVTKFLVANGLSRFRWQRNYYEHLVRNEKELEALREYIVYNASKWAFDSENPAAAGPPPGGRAAPTPHPRPPMARPYGGEHFEFGHWSLLDRLG